LRAALYDPDRPHVAGAELSTATCGVQPKKPPALDIRLHECRHSYVTHLRAAGINDADLAEIAGHRVETMLARYTHAVRQSHQAVRDVLG